MQAIRISDLNLIVTDDWRDLISLKKYDNENQFLELEPYATLWITNY